VVVLPITGSKSATLQGFLRRGGHNKTRGRKKGEGKRKDERKEDTTILNATSKTTLLEQETRQKGGDEELRLRTIRGVGLYFIS